MKKGGMIMNKSEFKELWARFETMVHANLLKKQKDTGLTVSTANLALKVVKQEWFEPYTILNGGLKKLRSEYPKVAAEFEKLLNDQMVFTEVKEEKPMSDYIVLGATAGTGIVGGGIGALFGAKVTTLIVTSVVPSVFAYMGLKAVQKNKITEMGNHMIQGYLEQLKKYEEKIEEQLK